MDGTCSWIMIICNADLRANVPEIAEALKAVTLESAEQDYSRELSRGQFY